MMSDLEKSEGNAASQRESHDTSPVVAGYHDVPYDPDTHLSPEDRAKIVRTRCRI